MGRRRHGKGRKRKDAVKRRAAPTAPARTPSPLPGSSRTPRPGEPLGRRLARLYGLEGARRYGGTVWTLAAGTVASYMGRGAAVPFVAVFLVQERALFTLGFMGAGILLEQAVRALLSPLFGGLSDRYGRKPFMIGGLLLQAVAIPSYFFVVDGPISYLAVSVVAGLGQAPYQPALSAFLADTTPAERRVGVFGLIHMTKNLGWLMGIGVGGIMLTTQGFQPVFIVGGLLPVVYALIILLFVQESRVTAVGPKVHPLVSAATAFRDARFVGFVAASIILFLSWAQLDTVLPIFITDGLQLDPLWITRAFFLNAVIVVLFQIPVSENVSRWSRPRGIALACGITTAAFFVFAASIAVLPSDPGLARMALLAGVVVMTIAEMIDTPLVFALAAELAPPNMTGGAMGVLALAAPIGLAAAPVAADALRLSFGWPMVWVSFAFVVLLGAGAFLLVGEGRPQPQDAPAAAVEAPLTP